MANKLMSKSELIQKIAETHADAVCHSAFNRDPGRYRRKSLNKHGYCAHGWGPNWTPIKSPENRQF